jgi:hypothetical protein
MTNKSGKAISLLRKIAHNDLPVDYLRKVNNTYARALKGLIYRHGTKLLLTQEGYDLLENYSTTKVAMRNEENDLSESVRSLLHVARLRILRKVS